MVGGTLLTWSPGRAGTGASAGSPRTIVSIWDGSSFSSAAEAVSGVGLGGRAAPEVAGGGCGWLVWARGERGEGRAAAEATVSGRGGPGRGGWRRGVQK